MGAKDIPLLREKASFLWRYSLQSFAVILLLAIFIRSFLFTSYVMSGSAMLPTIWPGDFLIGGKVRVREVKRGDVVALRCPLYKDKLCLKRVVALPGDRVEFQGDILVINGQKAQYFPIGAFKTELVAGSSWAIWPEPSTNSSTAATVAAVVVPPLNLYLVNDKRADRDDSRTWGPVTLDFLEARITRVWMSLDWYDGERVRTWPRIRWSRLLRGID